MIRVILFIISITLITIGIIIQYKDKILEKINYIYDGWNPDIDIRIPNFRKFLIPGISISFVLWLGMLVLNRVSEVLEPQLNNTNITATNQFLDGVNVIGNFQFLSIIIITFVIILSLSTLLTMFREI